MIVTLFSPPITTIISILLTYVWNKLPTSSLQITFSYKPVICQARDKVWPDMQPVWSDITFVFHKWKYIFLFRVITEEPSQHVRSDSVFASQNSRICWTNVRCPALICRLATCMIQSPDLNAFDKNLESINLLILRTNCLCNYCQS